MTPGVQKLANEAHEEMHRNCDPGTTEDLSSWDHSRNTRGHQHSHSIPGSVASVAWMVIIGDGFHNFADGIAVGQYIRESLHFVTSYSRPISHTSWKIAKSVKNCGVVAHRWIQ